jgi:hypothetical protein
MHKDSWTPVREHAGHRMGEGCTAECRNMPFTMQDFDDHLAGTKTFGHYMLSPEGNTKLFAYDIDLNKTGFYRTDDSEEDVECNPREVWLTEGHPGIKHLTIQLRAMAEGLALAVWNRIEVPVAIATSGGKGLHVYGFTGSVPGDVARELATGILDGFGCFEATRGQNFYMHRSEYPSLSIEVFPKQANLDGKDFGNLMKLPLGVHMRTGRRSEFLTTKAPLSELVPMDPIAALTGQLPWQ